MKDASDPAAEQAITAIAPARSRTVGDLPEALRRRYLTAPEPGGVGLYVDHLTKVPALRDHGRRLIAARVDRNTLRDMALIAHHRGWSQVVIAGAPAFRREAWLALRAAGLETRGYRPTPRDLQALERRLDGGRHEQSEKRAPTPDLSARSRLAVVETVVNARITDPALRERALAAARARVAVWLERGKGFMTATVAPREPAAKTERKDRSRPR